MGHWNAVSDSIFTPADPLPASCSFMPGAEGMELHPHGILLPPFCELLLQRVGYAPQVALCLLGLCVDEAAFKRCCSCFWLLTRRRSCASRGPPLTDHCARRLVEDACRKNEPDDSSFRDSAVSLIPQLQQCYVLRLLTVLQRHLSKRHRRLLVKLQPMLERLTGFSSQTESTQVLQTLLWLQI